jgi:hypothetical protein
MNLQMQTGQVLRTPTPPTAITQLQLLTQDTVSCCTSCGSEDVSLVENYASACSQTGDSGADDYWRCYTCGARSEEIDERPTVIIIPPGSIFTPTTEDLLRWSTELARRERAKREGEAA